MNLALNELDSLAKRAARGAGYPWGIAEEAGKATAWLCANRLDGTGQLSLLLQHDMSTSIAKHRPIEKNHVWQSNATLCPLLTGCYLSDSADRLIDQTLEIRDVVAPMLLLPFVARVAIKHQCGFMMDCDGALAITDGGGADISSPMPDVAHVTTLSAGGNIRSTQENQNRLIIDDDQLKVLNQYASKTYAPDTEQSRLTGAGAGLTDND